MPEKYLYRQYRGKALGTGRFIEPARTPVTSVVFAGILGALYFQELHAKMVAGGHYLLK